ncbi:MAG: hypothetical protein DHS20C21_22700 [Gemmatimonadota bacterium]|nr:MAG: hypothetical protein DHS20C21_22700 [Gemmatimonadota bacterium]
MATSLFWLPTELPSLWASRRFHLLSSAADARDLSARLAAAGEKSMLVAEIPGTIPGPPTLSVRNPRFPEFSVDLHVVPLIPPASHTPQENAP